jgi:hypothetical protein
MYCTHVFFILYKGVAISCCFTTGHLGEGLGHDTLRLAFVDCLIRYMQLLVRISLVSDSVWSSSKQLVFVLSLTSRTVQCAF